MTSQLKGLVAGIRAASNWAIRHEGDFEKAGDVLEYLLPGRLVGRLIHRSADYSLDQARRFADGVESVFKGTMAYEVGTSTLCDRPRF